MRPTGIKTGVKTLTAKRKINQFRPHAPDLKATVVYRQRLFKDPGAFPVHVSLEQYSAVLPHILHCHNECEIHFVIRANSRYFVGGKLYPFRSNSALIVPPRQSHRFLHLRGAITEQWVVIFDLKLLKGRASEALAHNLPIFIPLSTLETNELDFRFRLLAKEYGSSKDYNRQFIINEIDQIMIRLKQAGKTNRPELYNHPRISKALSIIEARFREQLTITSLAKAIALSPSHFSHLFKHYTRMSVKQYILHRRVAEAKTLLERDPHQKLAPLAEQLGFSDLPLFNRCFRVFTNMTPSRFRRISQKDSRNC